MEQPIDLSGNGVRAIIPAATTTGQQVPTAVFAEQTPEPTPTSERASAPTVVPYLHPFEADLEVTLVGGSYRLRRPSCDRALSRPVWVTTTRFAWVCDDGRVLLMDAEVGREAWISDLRVNGLHWQTGRNAATTAAVGTDVVDATLFTIPAVGLGAESYELQLTVLDGGTGDQKSLSVFEVSSDRYWFWWSPLWSRVVVAFDDNSDTRHVIVIDTTTGEPVADLTGTRIVHPEQRLDNRHVPIQTVDDEETVQFLDLTTGTVTAAQTPFHQWFDHEEHPCSPYLLIKTSLVGDWHLLDPSSASPSVPVPDRYRRSVLTSAGAVIRNDDQWAMLTPAGITWAFDRSLGRRPNNVGGELSFQNQSGQRIAVDPTTGSEIGPALFADRSYHGTSNGHLIAGSTTIEFWNGSPCQ